MGYRRHVRQPSWPAIVLVCLVGLHVSLATTFAMTETTATVDDPILRATTPTPSPAAPPFDWATRGGGPENDEARGVTIDSSGAIVVVGTFQGDVTLFAANTPLRSRGMHDLFVAKLSSPTTIEWIRQFGEAGDDYAFDIVADDQGNSYATGCLAGTVDFDGFVLTSTESTPIDARVCGSGDVFTLKLDSGGRVIWAQQVGGPRPDGGNEVALDGRENVLVAANTFGSFDSGATDFAAQGNQDSYALNYDPDGRLRWAVPLAGPGVDQIRGIAGDPSGNALIAGRFTASIRIGGVPLTAAGTGEAQDIFVAKLDPTGVPLWAKRFGGLAEDYGRGIGTDAAGNVYVSGVFTGAVEFDTFTLTSIDESQDIFVVKLDQSGAVLWARSLGGSGKDEGCELEISTSGSVTLSGEFSGRATIGDNTFTSAGRYDLFVIRLDALGNPSWAIQAGGPGPDVNYALALDASGETITTVGTFQQSSAFDATTLTSAGMTDLFVAQQHAPVTHSDVTGPSTSGFGFTLNLNSPAPSTDAGTTATSATSPANDDPVTQGSRYGDRTSARTFGHPGATGMLAFADPVVGLAFASIGLPTSVADANYADLDLSGRSVE